MAIPVPIAIKNSSEYNVVQIYSMKSWIADRKKNHDQPGKIEAASLGSRKKDASGHN